MTQSHYLGQKFTESSQICTKNPVQFATLPFQALCNSGCRSPAHCQPEAGLARTPSGACWLPQQARGTTPDPDQTRSASVESHWSQCSFTS